MRVSVLYFASIRERAGCERERLELPEGARVRDAIEALRAGRPALGPLDRGVRFARNREFAAADEPLADGDELALLPPVSGG